MAIYNLDVILDKYGDRYLILDFNHLFISSSIREEVWLLQRKNDPALIDWIIQQAAEFRFLEVDPDRNFTTYSGGQQVILGCLLTMALIRAQECRGLKLLLNNVLDSVSEENRAILMQSFETICASHDIRLFTQQEEQLVEIVRGHEDTPG
jgi:hypothetical protein